jgi:hypothetical protein
MKIEGGLKFLLFQDLYSHYSRLELTVAKDRPLAIGSLETRLAQAFRVNARYGLFFDQHLNNALFCRSLLWCRGAGISNLDKILFPQGAKIPTWSWMAWHGPIDYMGASFSSAILRPIDMSYEKDSILSPDLFDNQLTAIMWPCNIDDLISVGTDLVILDMPGSMDDPPVNCIVVATKTRYSSRDDEYYVIFVRHAQDESYYERVGVGCISTEHIDKSGDGETIFLQ